MGTPHTPAKDSVLCTPVSCVACGGERGLEFWDIHLPAKNSVLCASVIYAFLKVQVTLPKESLSPSLIGVALSASRRLPLMRVEFVLFRSVTV